MSEGLLLTTNLSVGSHPAKNNEPEPSTEWAWIPFERLSKMTFALPPPGSMIHVLRGAEAPEAVKILQDMGRQPKLVSETPICSPGQQFRLWTVPPVLESRSRCLIASQFEPKGRALCLGCGSGREAVFLAGLGWDVTAVDHLPEALDQGRALASLYQLRPIEWVQADAVEFALEFGEGFNLMTSLMYFDPRLIPIGHELARRGGTAIYESYSEAHRISTGKPQNAKRVIHRRDLIELMDIEMNFEEGPRTSTLVLQPDRKRPS